MINPKEKEQLQAMWNKSETAGQDVPDGTYQFVVIAARFHMSDKGRPQFKTKVKIKGGAEEYIGKEIEINDNLETPENMGWFKKKLTRLNIPMPDDFDEVVDGTLAEQLVGKVFEGQAKTKNDFLNVYVNRLLGEQKVESHEEHEAGAPAEEPEEGDGFEEGDPVEWAGKTGTIIELSDDGRYRVKTADGKVYRVPKAQLTHAEADEAEVEDLGAEEQEAPADATELPTPEEAESLPAAEVKRVLKDLGIEAAKVKNARSVLHGIATLAADPKAKIELTEVAPLAAALGVDIKKGTPIKDAVKSLSAAVAELVGAN